MPFEARWDTLPRVEANGHAVIRNGGPFGAGSVLRLIREGDAVTRAELARVLVQDYVLAAAAAGSSTLRTVRRHLLPNVAPVLLVQLSLALSLAVLAEAALSYLGLGAPPPAPSWGRLLGELQSGVRAHPWAVVAPGAVVVATTLGLNLLGDGLRDATDPRLRRRIPDDPLGVGR